MLVYTHKILCSLSDVISCREIELNRCYKCLERCNWGGGSGWEVVQGKFEGLEVGTVRGVMFRGRKGSGGSRPGVNSRVV
jgi:hypothetical protein